MIGIPLRAFGDLDDELEEMAVPLAYMNIIMVPVYDDIDSVFSGACHANLGVDI